MPELPDITVFAANMKKRFSGKKLQKVKVIDGRRINNSEAELNKALKGHVLEDVYRSGKEFRFKFDGEVLMGLHLMLTGDLRVFEEENKYIKSTIVEFYFEGGTNFSLHDVLKKANVKLDPEDKEGIDALDLNYAKLRKIFQRKTQVKKIMLDQNIIRGIGNGYSDEILWQAGINPYSIAEAIPDEKIKELAKTIKKVLTGATKKIMKAYPDLITGEIKEFLLIHHKARTHSPTGAPIKIDVQGERKTFYTDEQVLYK